MKKILFTIAHSKGGIGKTEIAALTIDALLKQYGISAVKVYDNDSETPKLSMFKSIKPRHIQLYKLDSNGHVKAESLNIDNLAPVTDELENGKAQVVFVDNGSPSFQPFLSYFQANAVEMFKEQYDVEFIVITIVTADKVTHRAPIELLNSYGKSVKYVLIENEHFGEITYDTSVFDDAGAEYAIFKLERLTNAQYDTLIAAREKGMLLSEAITSKEFSLIHKSRLNTIQKSFEGPFLNILAEFGHEA